MHPTKFRFIWQSGFKGEDFLEINQSETRIVCGDHVCLTDRDEMSNCNRGLSIDASYQFLIICPNGFRGEESKKSANQKHESPVAAMFVNGSGRNE